MTTKQLLFYVYYVISIAFYKDRDTLLEVPNNSTLSHIILVNYAAI